MERAAQTAALVRSRAGRADLRLPLSAFLVVFGLAKVAELIDWSRLHHDAGAMLGLGSGTATVLLIAGKSGELLLTAIAALGLVRRSVVWPLAALAGWTADLFVLSVLAGIDGDLGRLLEHGLCFVAFAGLLAVAYTRGALSLPDATRASGASGTGGRLSQTQEIAIAALNRLRRAGSHDRPEPESAPAPGAGPVPRVSLEQTRLDLPVRRRSEVTRQDLPVRGSDVTRQDLPVRKGPAAEPAQAPDDDATRPDPGD